MSLCLRAVSQPEFLEACFGAANDNFLIDFSDLLGVPAQPGRLLKKSGAAAREPR